VLREGDPWELSRSSRGLGRNLALRGDTAASSCAGRPALNPASTRMEDADGGPPEGNAPTQREREEIEER
jgi:hypothetical protein